MQNNEDQISPLEVKSIRNLANSNLHSELALQVKLERTQLMRVIYYMREVDRRRLWAEMGYSSFVKYCVDQFGMSETSFYRKLAILQTMRDVPEVEAKILDGTLNASTITKVAIFVRRETKFKGRKVTNNEKREILKEIENKSERAVERELAARSPELPPPDRKKFISANQILNQYTSDVEVEEMATRLKEILVASLPKDFNHNDFLKKVYAIALNTCDPLRKIARSQKRKADQNKNLSQKTEVKAETFLPDAIAPKNEMKSDERQASETRDAADENQTGIPLALPKRCVKSRNGKTQRSYVSVHTKETVFRRDLGTCTYLSPLTGIKCDSKFAIQRDHIKTYARGGSNKSENLRLYCPAHNQFAAIKIYGPEHMKKFVPSLE